MAVDNRTIETYFKVDDAMNRQVFYKEGAEVNTIKFYVENGYLHLGSFRNDGGTNKSIFFRTPIQNDTWYHVALVLDNATNLLFYLDGVLQDSNPNYFQLPIHPGNFEIGRTQGPARYPNCATWTASGSVETCLGDVTANITTVHYFGGHIWGFRIWDVVRTATEIDDNKGTLITDTTSAPGDDLIAFLDGDSLTYLDSNGNFESEDVQGSVLGLEEQNLDELKIIVQANRIEVINTRNITPDALLLHSLDGKLVRQSQGQSYLSAAQLADGIYILNCVYQGQSINRKILVKSAN